MAIVLFFIAISTTMSWLLYIGAISVVISGLLGKQGEYEDLIYRLPMAIVFLAYVITFTIMFAFNS